MNRRSLIVAVVCMLSVRFISAQEVKVSKTHSIKVTFIGVGYAYEQPISPQSVVSFEAMLAGGFGSNIIYGDYWIVAPVIRVEPRHYYNFLKRAGKGKKTIGNAGNYISLSADWQLRESMGSNARAERTVSVVPKWGLRRVMGNHFMFEFATGVGAYKTDIDSWKSTLGIDLKMGFMF